MSKTPRKVSGPHPGRSKTQHAALQRWFGDLEVIEAQNDIRIQPNTADIETAIVGDPTQCAFSRACQRMWSSQVALFFETVAYVDLLDNTGIRRVERFTIGKTARAWIEAFDKGEPTHPGGFVLKAPTHGSTLDAEAARAKQRHTAILLGAVTPKTGTSSGPRKEALKWTGRRSMFHRSGTGMVHFVPESRARD